MRAGFHSGEDGHFRSRLIKPAADAEIESDLLADAAAGCSGSNLSRDGARVNSNRSASASIALGRLRTGSLDHRGAYANNRRTQTMAWKNFVSRPAIASRSRAIATTFMYALSVTVRFTTATGNETKIPAQSAHRTNPLIFIMTGDGLPISCKDQGPKSAQSTVFPGGFRSEHARPMAVPARPHA
jgi:hypothetical protein